MIHNLETAVLKAFVTVSKTGSFSDAARLLHRSQPAISQQIKKLETNTQHKLFQREGQKVILTRQGEMLLRYAKEIVELTESAKSCMSFQRPVAEFKIGAPDDYAQGFLREPITILAEEFPHISFSISCGNSLDLINRWVVGELDYCVVATPPNAAIGHTLKEEPLAWTSSLNWDESSDIVPLAGFPSGCYVRDAMETSLDSISRPWRNVFSSNSILAIQSVVISGTAITAIERCLVPAGTEVAPKEWGLPELPDIRIATLSRFEEKSEIQPRLNELVRSVA